MTTPTAAVAAPVAAPVDGGTTPVVAPVAAAPIPAAPAAVPAAPAVAPVVDPAAPAVDLFGAAAPAVAAAVPAVAPVAAPLAVDPAAPAAWALAEGVNGTGNAPEWFKADKYKTVADQAKAYPELEKKLGGFTGAPADGKYKVNMPEGVVGSIDLEHPMTKGLMEWAAQRQMSQEAFDEAMGMFAEYEASMVPSVEEVKATIGENADARIQAVGQWAQANLPADQFEQVRKAGQSVNAAQVFLALEAIVNKTRQPAMPKPGADVPGVGLSTEAEINALQAKINPLTGNRFYAEDAKYRANVEAMRITLYKNLQGPARSIT